MPTTQTMSLLSWNIIYINLYFVLLKSVMITSLIRIVPQPPNYMKYIPLYHKNPFQSITTTRALSSSLSSLQSIIINPPFVPPTSMEECIDWIDQYCDRTFLYAVIASDYHFLYRGISTSVIESDVHQQSTTNTTTTTTTTSLHPLLQPTIQNDIPDLLQIETYGIDGVQFFQRIEDLLQNTTIRPSIGHLGTTISTEAAIWGNYSASIWPSSVLLYRNNDSIPTSIRINHSYAWFDNGGLFYPRPNIDNRSSNDDLRRSIRIVTTDVGSECVDHNDDPNDDDMIDNLIDALRYKDGCEIMFTANTYLAIPSIYDVEIRDQLRRSFLI